MRRKGYNSEDEEDENDDYEEEEDEQDEEDEEEDEQDEEEEEEDEEEDEEDEDQEEEEDEDNELEGDGEEAEDENGTDEESLEEDQEDAQEGLEVGIDAEDEDEDEDEEEQEFDEDDIQDTGIDDPTQDQEQYDSDGETDDNGLIEEDEQEGDDTFGVERYHRGLLRSMEATQASSKRRQRSCSVASEDYQDDCDGNHDTEEADEQTTEDEEQEDDNEEEQPDSKELEGNGNSKTDSKSGIAPTHHRQGSLTERVAGKAKQSTGGIGLAPSALEVKTVSRPRSRSLEAVLATKSVKLASASQTSVPAPAKLKRRKSTPGKVSTEQIQCAAPAWTPTQMRAIHEAYTKVFPSPELQGGLRKLMLQSAYARMLSTKKGQSAKAAVAHIQEYDTAVDAFNQYWARVLHVAGVA